MTTAEKREAADKRFVAIAADFGCRPALGRIIVKYARLYGVPISLAFALVDQESDFKNVFGHDPTIYVGAGTVNKRKYSAYKKARQRSGNRQMQGVGVCQLTWWETQDLADKLGGCHTSDANVRVGLLTLAARIREHGYVKGIARYNGSGPAADEYSRKLRALAHVWHGRLA